MVKLSTKNKLKRKDKFKEVKKGIIPMNKCPEFIKKNWDNFIMADNGICQFKNNTFDKIYEIKKEDNIGMSKELFSLLRKYDINFRLYNINCKEYLRIFFNTHSIDDVWVECDNIEKIIFKEFKDIGINITSINNSDRLRIAHEFITEKRPVIENYIDNNQVLNWKRDLEIDLVVKEHYGLLECNNNNKKYIMFFINKFSNKIVNFIDELQEKINIKGIMYDVFPVSDKEIKLFIESNYIGYENLLYEMQKQEPALYNVYVGNSETESRYFSLFGITFLCNVETTEELQIIKMLSDRYDVGIKFFHINVIDCFKEFCSIGILKYSQTRCIKSSELCELFNNDDIERSEMSAIFDNPINLNDISFEFDIQEEGKLYE